jgi:hypothetical protein
METDMTITTEKKITPPKPDSKEAKIAALRKASAEDLQEIPEALRRPPPTKEQELRLAMFRDADIQRKHKIVDERVIKNPPDPTPNTAKAPPPIKPASSTAQPTPTKPAQSQEATMAKTTTAKTKTTTATKKPTKAAAPKAPARELRPDGLVKGSGMAKLVDAVCRPKGATNAELCEAVGWAQCLPMMKKSCDKAGVTVRVEKKAGEPARYFGTAKKAKAAPAKAAKEGKPAAAPAAA